MLAGRAKPVTTRRVLHGIVQTVLALTAYFTASWRMTRQNMLNGAVMHSLHTLTIGADKFTVILTYDSRQFSHHCSYKTWSVGAVFLAWLAL
jgi:hypothetical protein